MVNLKIKVESGIKPQAHSSFEYAVKNSREDIENYQKIREKLVSRTEYNFENIDIFFKGTDYSLRFSIGNNRINCEILKEHQNNVRSKQELPKNFSFNYSGAIFNWNGQQFLDGLVGREITLAPSDQFMFVFVKDDHGNICEYMCDYLIDLNDQYQPFLHFSEY